jgi:hypothetical protein
LVLVSVYRRQQTLDWLDRAALLREEEEEA